MRINGLDLFSGIGGIALALHPWVQTVAYCEIEKYPQNVLLANMERGNLDTAPIYPDVTQLRGEYLEHRIDIITGGSPCQDISVAGLGRGLEGERSGLFFEIVRLACELSPSYIFLENVPAITSRGGATVIAQLTKIGYECRWTTLSAKAVGANHKRERWWLLARRLDTHAPTVGCDAGSLQDLRCQEQNAGRAKPCDMGEEASSVPTTCDMANPYGHRLKEISPPPLGNQEERYTRRATSPWSSSWWATEPPVGPLADGIPNRIPAIKALGNSVVPLQARVAFEYLLKGTISCPNP